MTDRRQVLGYALCLPLLGIPRTVFAQPAAQYLDTPQTEWLQDGTRRMRLLRRFRYRDPAGLMWTAPRNALIDGASIPRLAWTVAGSPFDPPYRDASIIHDYYCDSMTRSWESTHLVFLNGMITSGASPVEATTKYWAVLRAGPRWDATHRWSGLWPVRYPRVARDIPPAPPPTDAQMAEWSNTAAMVEISAQQQFEDVSARIASGELTAEDLPALANEQIQRQPPIPQ